MVRAPAARAYWTTRLTGSPLLVLGSIPRNLPEEREPFDSMAGARLSKAGWGGVDLQRFLREVDRAYLNPVQVFHGRRRDNAPVAYDSGAGRALLDVLGVLVAIGEVACPEAVLVLGAPAKVVLTSGEQVLDVPTFGVLNPSAGRSNLMMDDPSVRLRNGMRIREAFKTAGLA